MTEAMLRRAAAGEASAWEALVTAYTRRVYALLVQQCGDRDLAEEITQQTFVKIYTRLDRYEEQGRFESWLFRVAVNGLRDEIRRRRRQAQQLPAGEEAGTTRSWSDMQPQIRPRPGQSDTLGGGDPFDEVSRGEQIERLKACIADLPEADQQLLHLRHTAGLTFAEIAETLEQPLGTVLARGHRALKKLRQMMEEQPVDG